MQRKGDFCWMSVSGAPFPDLARLVGIGARRVEVGQGDQPWVVLAGPEDNEFCVLGRRADT